MYKFAGTYVLKGKGFRFACLRLFRVFVEFRSGERAEIRENTGGKRRNLNNRDL